MYTEYEICRIFRNADIKLDRIKLLQELTMLDRKTIIEILEKHGYELTVTVKTKNQHKKVLTKEIFMELYNKGLSDSKISKQIGLTEGAIRYWRDKKFKLPANGRKKLTNSQLVSN